MVLYILTKPVRCKRVTPQANIRKQLKSDSSAADHILNFLPKAWLGYFIYITSFSTKYIKMGRKVPPCLLMC